MDPRRDGEASDLFLTESIYQVVLQKSIPARICQLILYKNKLMDLWGNQVLQNDFVNAFCEIKTRVIGGKSRVIHVALHSKPETRNPELETRNPNPETRDLKPETRNPKPETRHPCVGPAGPLLRRPPANPSPENQTPNP